MYYFHRSLMSFIPSNVAIIIFKGISNIPSPIIFCKLPLLYKRFLSNSSRSSHFSFHHFSLALYFFPHSSLLCFLFSSLSSVALPFHFLLSYIFLLISSETYGSFDTVISFLHPILVFALANSASFSSISLPFSP